MSLSHRQACASVASYLMTLKWCAVACVEVAGTRVPFAESPPVVDHRYLRDPEAREARQQVIWDYEDRRAAWRKSPASGGGVLDVLAFGRGARPRIAIAEVKVSEGDLRADLRARKMLRYEPQATHVYLAAPKPLLELAPSLGLPDWWGLVEIRRSRRDQRWRVAYMERRPKTNPYAPTVTPDRLNDLAWQVATSLARRVVSPISPVTTDMRTEAPSVTSGKDRGELDESGAV